jgi:hypothetical protein
MKRNRKDDEKTVRLELKYCEHCGGLWLRECGAGVVYCVNYLPRIAELPAARKSEKERVILPVRGRTVVDGMNFDLTNDLTNEDVLDEDDDLDIDGMSWDATGGTA